MSKVTKKSKKKSTSPTSSKKKINGAKKGKQFERDVANAILHIFPEAQRMLEYQASKVIGIDIENTDRFKIQCKRNQTYAPIGRIKEVQVNDETDVPLLVTKGNNLEAMAVLPFRCLIEMMESLYGLAPLWSETEGKRIEAEEVSKELLTYDESDPYKCATLNDFL